MKKPLFLDCFQFAVQHISAYQKYLLEHHIDDRTIIDLASFQKIPATDKNSYILKYPTKTLFKANAFPALGHTSSGSSGTPTLWFRGTKQASIGAKMHAEVLTNVFNVQKQEPTLVLVCFAMGMWIAGTYTLMSFYELSKKGYQITSFATGMDPDAICSILKKSASDFKNIVFLGYPFFMEIVLAEILKQNIRLTNPVFIMTSGDKFSENTRENMLSLLNTPQKSVNNIISIYGSSDAGFLGHETPLSIAIRKATLKNPSLYSMIFDNAPISVMPTLIQYHPNHIFFEEQSGELLITANLDCPLIRYNIHDGGKVFTFSEMKSLIKNDNALNQLFKNTRWKLPFVMIDKKSDVSVVFEATKIFPEQIKSAILDPSISHFLSGSFIAYTQKDENHHNRLYFDLELSIGVPDVSEKTTQKIAHCFVEHLKTLNAEYRNTYKIFSTLAVPIITCYPWGSTRFQTNHISQPTLVGIAGKKSKLVN